MQFLLRQYGSCSRLFGLVLGSSHWTFVFFHIIIYTPLFSFCDPINLLDLPYKIDRSKLFASQKLENVLLHSCAKLPKIIGLMHLLHMFYGEKRILPFGGTCMCFQFHPFGFFVHLIKMLNNYASQMSISGCIISWLMTILFNHSSLGQGGANPHLLPYIHPYLPWGLTPTQLEVPIPCWRCYIRAALSGLQWSSLFNKPM